VGALNIRFNGDVLELDAGTTIHQLMTRLGYDRKNVAVAVNREFVPRSSHPGHVLKENDEVDVVAPMQGG